jgi:hypothetical protein
MILVEVNSKTVREKDPIKVPSGPTLIITPPIDEDYWLYRVQLKHGQSIVAFPKFFTIGCGFAKEEDWNTNLPLLSCSPERLFDHIKHNKGFDDISDEECIAAIKALQEFVKSHEARGTSHESL